jgi:hypothetical protein
LTVSDAVKDNENATDAVEEEWQGAAFPVCEKVPCMICRETSEEDVFLPAIHLPLYIQLRHVEVGNKFTVNKKRRTEE